MPENPYEPPKEVGQPEGRAIATVLEWLGIVASGLWMAVVITLIVWLLLWGHRLK